MTTVQQTAPALTYGPANPLDPSKVLEPFQALLYPPRAHRLQPGWIHDVDIAETTMRIHPDLPAVPAWGFGRTGQVQSPGPLLEAAAGQQVLIRWRNRLPASVHPNAGPAQPRPSLPFRAVYVPSPPDGLEQNRLGVPDGSQDQDTSMTPLGWTAVHLHGAHSRSNDDGWPDNMAATGGQQVATYDNDYDNADLGLDKIGAFLWYHDHAMNGTRFHVYAGLAGGYLVRDPREHQLGLPTAAEEGEVFLLLQDRNLTTAGQGQVELLHKTTADTAELFGPLTLVDGKLWPRLPLRQNVYRLRLLNGSNARTYRLHLVSAQSDGSTVTVTPQHARLTVIGSDGGLLWTPWHLGDDQALVLAPSERLDVLIDLTGLHDGEQLHLINSAAAPFGGGPLPTDLSALWQNADPANLNPYPWVMRFDVDSQAPTPGRPATMLTAFQPGKVLNDGFRRLLHDSPAEAGAEPSLPIGDHAHRTILLAETLQPGHLYLQELVEDANGTIEVQLTQGGPTQKFRVDGWPADDPNTPSSSRVSFYDHIALRPAIGQWQVWRFVNATGDTHPIHIHQSNFQPLGTAGVQLTFSDSVNGQDVNRYDPERRTTSAPLTYASAGRSFEAHEVQGWNDVIRVDPGNVVEIAIRFDTPGRYVYHCHILEHEDTEMMRPFVATVTPMEDGPMAGMAGMATPAAAPVPAAPAPAAPTA